MAVMMNKAKYDSLAPELKAVIDKLDAPLLYLDGPDYARYVNTVYQKETVLIDKLKLRDLMR